jgi:hypothetical protein
MEQDGDHRAEILSGSATTDQRLARRPGSGEGTAAMTIAQDEWRAQLMVHPMFAPAGSGWRRCRWQAVRRARPRSHTSGRGESGLLCVFSVLVRVGHLGRHRPTAGSLESRRTFSTRRLHGAGSARSAKCDRCCSGGVATRRARPIGMT